MLNLKSQSTVGRAYALHGSPCFLLRQIAKRIKFGHAFIDW